MDIILLFLHISIRSTTPEKHIHQNTNNSLHLNKQLCSSPLTFAPNSQLSQICPNRNVLYRKLLLFFILFNHISFRFVITCCFFSPGSLLSFSARSLNRMMHLLAISWHLINLMYWACMGLVLYFLSKRNSLNCIRLSLSKTSIIFPERIRCVQWLRSATKLDVRLQESKLQCVCVHGNEGKCHPTVRLTDVSLIFFRQMVELCSTEEEDTSGFGCTGSSWLCFSLNWQHRTSASFK